MDRYCNCPCGCPLVTLNADSLATGTCAPCRFGTIGHAGPLRKAGA